MSNYCGIGKVPKGKKRGTAEKCAKLKQIRYYGIQSIDPSILNKNNEKKNDLVTEQFKLKKLEEKAKRLIKDIMHEKLIISKSTDKQLKKSEKKLKLLNNKKAPLIKKLKLQSDKVKKLEPKIYVPPKNIPDKIGINKYLKSHESFLKSLDKKKSVKGGCSCEDKYEKYYEMGKNIGDIINNNHDGMLLSALIKGLIKD